MVWIVRRIGATAFFWGVAMRGLNERMRRFAGEYVKDFCPVNAAVRAGYAESFAKIRALELLKDGRVQLLVRELVVTSRAQVKGYRYLVKRDLAELVARRATGENCRRGSEKPLNVEPSDPSEDGTEVLTEDSAETSGEGTDVLAEDLGRGEARHATQGSGVAKERGKGDGDWGVATSNAGATQASGVPRKGTEVSTEDLAERSDDGTEVLTEDSAERSVNGNGRAVGNGPSRGSENPSQLCMPSSVHG